MNSDLQALDELSMEECKTDWRGGGLSEKLVIQGSRNTDGLNGFDYDN